MLPRDCTRQAQAERSWKDWRRTAKDGTSTECDVKGWLVVAENVWSDMLGVLVNLLRFEAGHSLGVLMTLAMVCEAWVRGLSADTDTHACLVKMDKQSSHNPHSCFISLTHLNVYNNIICGIGL